MYHDDYVHQSMQTLFQFCTHRESSDKKEFPTFARTRPPDTQISKSVVSVLMAFNWTKVSRISRDARSRQTDPWILTDFILESIIDSICLLASYCRLWLFFFFFNSTEYRAKFGIVATRFTEHKNFEKYWLGIPMSWNTVASNVERLKIINWQHSCSFVCNV